MKIEDENGDWQIWIDTCFIKLRCGSKVRKDCFVPRIKSSCDSSRNYVVVWRSGRNMSFLWILQWENLALWLIQSQKVFQMWGILRQAQMWEALGLPGKRQDHLSPTPQGDLYKWKYFTVFTIFVIFIMISSSKTVEPISSINICIVKLL